MECTRELESGAGALWRDVDHALPDVDGFLEPAFAQQQPSQSDEGRRPARLPCQ